VLIIVSIIKLVCEIALLALVGRFVLGLLAGDKRETNPFYQLLHIMCKPFLSVARLISPRQVIDRHVPLVAFLVLAFVWLFVTFQKIQICMQIGVEACK
jgi:uncharacterized protein YggT (Ycf19 family)